MKRIAIVGAGDVVRVRHLPLLRDYFSDEVRVESIMTSRDHAYKDAAGIYGAPIRRVATVGEALATSPDIVLVAVPPAKTAEVCALTLSSGVPTYSEKPIAASYVAGVRVAQTAETFGTPYIVGENFYFQDRFAIASQLLTSEQVVAVRVDDFLRRGGRENPRTDEDLAFEHFVHPLNAAFRLAGVNLPREADVAAQLSLGATSVLQVELRAPEFESTMTLTIREEWSKDDYSVSTASGRNAQISHRYDFGTKTYTDVVSWSESATRLQIDTAECGIRYCWRQFLDSLQGSEAASSRVKDTVRLGLLQAIVVDAAKLSVRTAGRRVPVQLG